MAADNRELLLSVRNLSVSFPARRGNFDPARADTAVSEKEEGTDGGRKKVADGISFDIRQGEIVGIVGESGSGKSMTALALMGLLPAGAERSADGIWFDGQDLSRLSGEENRKLKGSKLAMIFQEPMTSLNPVYTVGKQTEEMLRLHTDCTAAERRIRTIRAFEEAGLPDPERLLDQYPHQLSGGQRQRVMIAMAMICGPKLLIADEPTTALDVTVQARILKLIGQLNREHGTAVLFISHDLGVIQRLCERVLVMYNGRIIEQGTIGEIFKNPKEAYTRTLLDAVPGFHKRSGTFGEAREREILLRVEDLEISYEGNRRGILGRRDLKKAVGTLSFEVYQGEILGLVGESGCGKSTTARAIAGLIKDYEGRILTGDGQAAGVLRPQMVFQDPYGSLNPSKRIGWILEEPLKMRGIRRGVDRVGRVKEMLAEVGLDPEYASRYPKDLSGGQRQRIAIAAALIAEPKLLILDEPVSALDVTVQAQILNLLLRLRKRHGLTYLFISHDMNVIYQICDRVCVMYQGKIVETAGISRLVTHPEHEYTKRLLEDAASLS